MNDPLILTFVVEVGSICGMLINKKGEITASLRETLPVPYTSPEPGWAEQEPDACFLLLCRISASLSEKSPSGFTRVIACTVTTLRDCCICLDKDGNPLRDMILWMDGRQADEPHFPMWVRMAFGLSGKKKAQSARYRESAANWIRENQPEIWEKTDQFVLLSTYLHGRLTGQLRDTPANMTDHVPFDAKKRTWYSARKPARYACDIPLDKLCTIIDPGAVVGVITEEASRLSGIPAGLPLIGTGAAKSCETLGLSVLREDQAALSLNEAASIQFSVRRCKVPERFLSVTSSVLPGCYNPELQLPRGCWLLDWFQNQFAVEERQQALREGCSIESILNRHLEEIPPGCQGLLLHPYWTPTPPSPESRGAIIGFTEVHTRWHIYRAMIEGINFALYDGMLRLQKRSGQKIRELCISGAGASSDEIAQLTANQFGLPVKRMTTSEPAGLGSALAAFVSLGEFPAPEAAVAAMVHEEKTFTPDVLCHQIYATIYKEAYRPMERRLPPLYKCLHRVDQLGRQ